MPFGCETTYCSLRRRHVFGLRVDVKDGVHVLDDGVVLYVAGNCIVLHAMEARAQVQLASRPSNCGGMIRLLKF